MILAVLGAKAFYLLYIWLASAIATSWLSNYKGYGEKVGLGTGPAHELHRRDHLAPLAGQVGLEVGCSPPRRGSRQGHDRVAAAR